MLAYALVLDTPFFAKTNAQGKAILKNLPKGDYQLTLWHPQQKRNTAVQKTLNIPTKNSNLSFKMSLKPNWRNLNKKPKKISPKDLYDSYDGLF
jgi:hypothetical protein